MEMRSDAYRAISLAQFFSFEGRVRRMTFWINTLVCGLISFILSFAFTETRFSMYSLETEYIVTNKPIYYVATLVIIVRSLSVAARRWQDQEKPGGLAVTLLYPVLISLFPNFILNTGLGVFIAVVGSIVLLVAVGFMGFVPGDDGENMFGPPPVEGQIL
jgi:uncharacterized membrane protein YhaH (DUF805 family)